MAVSAAERTALDALFEPFNRTDSPGLVVGIARRGHTIYRRGLGLASVQHGLANLPTTRMRIASVSKHFTSLACLLLVEDGRLDLETPVASYLPEFAGLPTRPTVRQFLDHTSGFRCSLELGTVANGLALQPREWQFSTLARQSAVNFEPGQDQVYCNGTYAALSELIERLSGKSYESFLADRIFEPLGMRVTESVRDPAQVVPGMAALHVRAEDGSWHGAPAEAELRGDGGIVSSIDDMLRWLVHLNGPKTVGSEATWRQLLEPATLANGSRSTYCLGLKRHLYRGVEVIHHSGGLIGLHCQLLTVPAHGLDVVIMVNGAPASATQLSWKVLDALLAEHLGSPRVVASAEDFPHLIGRHYVGASGVSLGFEGTPGGQLAVSLFGITAAPVLFDEGNSLRAGFEDIGIGPYELNKADLARSSDGGAPDTIDLHIAGHVESLSLQPTAPVPSQRLSALAGRYFSPDLNADAELRVESGELVLYLRGDYSSRRRLALRAISASHFVAEESPPNAGRYALNFDGTDGRLAGFFIDTYRARRLRFDRVPDRK